MIFRHDLLQIFSKSGKGGNVDGVETDSLTIKKREAIDREASLFFRV
jgi:hypothetical protein